MGACDKERRAVLAHAARVGRDAVGVVAGGEEPPHRLELVGKDRFLQLGRAVGLIVVVDRRRRRLVARSAAHDQRTGCPCWRPVVQWRLGRRRWGSGREERLGAAPCGGQLGRELAEQLRLGRAA